MAQRFVLINDRVRGNALAATRLAKALEKFETARHELSYMRADDVPLSDTVAGEILTCGHLREVCAAYREVRAVLAAKASKP